MLADKALSLAPDSVLAVTNMGNYYAKQKMPVEARKWFKRAAELDPYSPFAHVGIGTSELVLDVDGLARVMLLGGEPFPEPITMWWNFVARTHDEIDAAYASWRDDDGRFGRVTSTLPTIPAPAPPWLRP